MRIHFERHWTSPELSPCLRCEARCGNDGPVSRRNWCAMYIGGGFLQMRVKDVVVWGQDVIPSQLQMDDAAGYTSATEALPGPSIALFLTFMLNECRTDLGHSGWHSAERRRTSMIACSPIEKRPDNAAAAIVLPMCARATSGSISPPSSWLSPPGPLCILIG